MVNGTGIGMPSLWMESNDRIVPITSERGGLTESNSTLIPAVDHLNVHQGAITVDKVKGLLEEEATQGIQVVSLWKGFDYIGKEDSMKKILSIIMAWTLCSIGHSVPTAWAFKIINLSSSSTVEAGSTVKVKIDPEGVSVLVGVLFDAYGEKKGWGSTIGSDFVVLPPYNWSFTLPPNYVGTVTINAIGKVFGQKTGEPPQAEVKILVTLPSTVTLQGLRIRDDQRYIFMSRISEDEKIRVYGQFSDGVERDISSSATGTTYTSSDEKIATVDSNGLVTAVAPGTTKITIKNGKHEVTVRVDVKPKK